MAAMEELGYQPHASARALRSRRSGILGLVVPYHDYTDTPNQYRYIVNLARECRRHGYELLLSNSEEGIDSIRRLIDSAQCEGLIVMDVLEKDPRVEAARHSRIPSVFIGLSADCEGVTSLDTDFEEIARQCVNHLLEVPHERATVIGPSSEHMRPMGFLRRFNTALREAAEGRLELTWIDVARGYLPMRTGLETLLTTGTAPNAYIIAPGASAEDAVIALMMLGVVPGADVSLIGASGPADSSHAPLDYSYYDADVTAVTRAALDLLSTKLRHDASAEPVTRRIQPVFHRGASLLAPARQPRAAHRGDRTTGPPPHTGTPAVAPRAAVGGGSARDLAAAPRPAHRPH